MAQVSLQDLLKAGTHFGHQTKRWNPKMKRFILCPRNGIYIIDLNKTQKNLENFISKVKAEVSKGGKILFVGTKKQIKDCIREEAERCGMPYVSERWLGGMLTNFKTIKQSIAKLEKIEAEEANGTLAARTKKEALQLMKKKEKLISVLSGIRDMKKAPSLIFIVDAIKEHIAIDEARRLHIPIGAIVDTNCDPDKVDFPIPGNDDAIKSVQLITGAIADAVLEVAPAVTKKDSKKVATPNDSDLEEQLAAKDAEESVDSKDKKDSHRVVRKKLVKES